jgi:TRAP-type mannitol/chloroaromatic compound transport system permease small subunit
VKHLVGCIDAINGRVARLAAWLVVPLFLIMGYEVFARFVLGWPTFWSWELAYMITGSHFVLGIAYVTRKRQHVRVDFLYSRFAPRTQNAIDGAVYTFFLLPLTAWMTWRLGMVALEAYRVGETSGESAWNPVIWPIRAITALGFGFFCLQILAEAVRCARALFGASDLQAESGNRRQSQ